MAAAGAILMVYRFQFGDELQCKMAAIGSSNISTALSERVRITSEKSGSIDFTALVPDWERICIVEVNEPGQPEYNTAAIAQGARRIGENACWGWNPNRVTFLVTSKLNEYAFFYVDVPSTFGSIDLKTTVAGSDCMDLNVASAACHRSGYLRQLSCQFHSSKMGE